MREIIKKHRWFFLLFSVYMVIGFVLLLLLERGDIYLLINKNHSIIQDYFFYYLTYFGDGRTYFFLALFIMFFVRFRDALVIGITGAVSGIILAILKQLVFSEVLRPKGVFADILEELHFVDGVTLHTYHSFPSGHTSTAFTLMTILMFLYGRNRIIDISFFILAFLTGISRIYLSQHFFVDTYAGTFLGVLISFICFYIYNKNRDKFVSPNWNRSILRRNARKKPTV